MWSIYDVLGPPEPGLDCPSVPRYHQRSPVNQSINQSIDRSTHLYGARENAGLENDGPTKSRGWKMQDWNLADQIAGLENAESENAGQNVFPLNAYT